MAGQERKSGVRPSIVIIGSGASGVALAALLDDVDAEVTLLRQVLPPGRKPIYHGLVDRWSAHTLGVSEIHPDAMPISYVTHVDLVDPSVRRSLALPGMKSLAHEDLLRLLNERRTLASSPVTKTATATGFLWDSGHVAGVICEDSGERILGDLLVFADESDPRLPEHLGLRPDWLPTELMHLGKIRCEADPEFIAERFGDGLGGHRVMSFRHDAHWGSPGWGLIIPGHGAVTLLVAMLLEEEMASARHIGEYLEEIRRTSFVHETLDGFDAGALFTEVIPIGGFDTRNRFHADRVLVMNDLVGVTHPLNRDGFSTNLSMVQAAATTIGEAVAQREFGGAQLAPYTTRLSNDVIGPVNAGRRTNKALRAQPAWQWASLPEVISSLPGVTSSGKSATLPGRGETGVWNRLRHFGRTPGVRKHEPGEYDE